MKHGPAKREALSHPVILVATDAPARAHDALHVWFLPARFLNKPVSLSLGSGGAAFHAGGLWLLQRMLHSRAVAGGSGSGWSYQRRKRQDGYPSVTLMVYLSRSRTLTPVLLLQRRNKAELKNELVANTMIALSLWAQVVGGGGGGKPGEGGKKKTFNAA